MNKELEYIMNNFCTDKTNNYYTSSMDDFIDNKKPDLEFECPEHWMPKVPRVQKEYKVSTLSNKQNKPVKTVETREVDKR